MRRLAVEWMRVIENEDVLCLADLSGHILPIKLGEQPIKALTAGWTVAQVYAVSGKFTILDLCHWRGESSFWLIAETGVIVCNAENFSQLSQENTTLIDLVFHTRNVVEQLIANGNVSSDKVVALFFRISQSSRNLFASAITKYNADIRLIDLAKFEKDQSYPADSIQINEYNIIHSQLVQNIKVRINEQFVDALHNGILKWPLITDGGFSSIVHCMFFDYLFGVLRVYDPATGLVFYVAFDDSDPNVFGIFVPACMVVFGWSTGPQSRHFARLAARPSLILASLQSYILNACEALPHWLSSAPLTTGHFLWPSDRAHLGHYIWNEMTGLEKIVQSTSAERCINIWQLCYTGRTDFYGSVEDLYPELAGRINR